MQGWRNSVANALDLRLSCINPSIYYTPYTSCKLSFQRDGLELILARTWVCVMVWYGAISSLLLAQLLTQSRYNVNHRRPQIAHKASPRRSNSRRESHRGHLKKSTWFAIGGVCCRLVVVVSIHIIQLYFTDTGQSHNYHENMGLNKSIKMTKN